MNKQRYILSLVLILSFFSCTESKTEKSTSERAINISTDLQVDHFNIWVTKPEKAKQRLTDIGFIAVPDSLSTIHKGQGTTGKYFNFLNGYLELIFVYDQNEFDQNVEINKDLDFVERANFEKNGASPFSIALKVKDYDITKIPFEKITYHQDWMDENVNIFTAKNSKIHLKEPSIFVVYPQLEAENFASLSELKNIPEEYVFWRKYYQHPNGAKKVTKIIITSTGLDLNTATIQTLNGIENLTVQNGSKHLMELYFDENIQGKSFDLRPDLPLVIYL